MITKIMSGGQFAPRRHITMLGEALRALDAAICRVSSVAEMRSDRDPRAKKRVARLRVRSTRRPSEDGAHSFTIPSWQTATGRKRRFRVCIGGAISRLIEIGAPGAGGATGADALRCAAEFLRPENHCTWCVHSSA